MDITVDDAERFLQFLIKDVNGQLMFIIAAGGLGEDLIMALMFDSN